MKLQAALVGLFVLSGSVDNVFAIPECCQGVCTNTHDPSIIRRDDGKYFRFSTGNKIAIHSASDISGSWEYLGAALPNNSTIKLPGNDDLWAPDVNKVGDTYFLYYSVSSFGKQNSAIGIAQSKTMEPGSWSDVGSTGVTSDASKRYNAIDPNLFLVGSQYYLNFGSYWHGLHQTPMESVPVKASGNAPYQLVYASREVVEAAFEFAYNGYYYMFYSKGSCCGYLQKRPKKGEEYRVLVCRSTSPTGGFMDKSGKDCRKDGGTIVLESHSFVYGPGGQGVFDDPKHGPVIYYHYVDTRKGYGDGDKLFGWNKLDFSSGWPVIIEPKKEC
ncbi:putative glycoside hydrolase, family 43 [Plasmopara halstedii]